MNPKSDIPAKAAFVRNLKSKGFDDIKTPRAPADITAFLQGKKYYFEIKYTKAIGNYFGAATLTEWEAALKHSRRFKFVIAEERNGRWHFQEYTPKEFIRFSYVVPFKIYFNVPIGSGKASAPSNKSRRISLTPSRAREMMDFFAKLRINM